MNSLAIRPLCFATVSLLRISLLLWVRAFPFLASSPTDNPLCQAQVYNAHSKFGPIHWLWRFGASYFLPRGKDAVPHGETKTRRGGNFYKKKKKSRMKKHPALVAPGHGVLRLTLHLQPGLLGLSPATGTQKQQKGFDFSFLKMSSSLTLPMLSLKGQQRVR